MPEREPVSMIDADQLAEDQLPERACLLLYDGECRLCIFAKAPIDQLAVGQSGTDVRFLAYQSDEAKLALGRAYRPGRHETVFLIQPFRRSIPGARRVSPSRP